MKKVLLLLFSFFPVLAQCQPFVDDTQARTKKLVWAEEFDKDGLPDETTWNFEMGKARANNEPQYHTKDLKNVRVEDGKLIINFKAGQPGIDDSIFPQEFIVDYVRLYELN